MAQNIVQSVSPFKISQKITGKKPWVRETAFLCLLVFLVQKSSAIDPKAFENPYAWIDKPSCGTVVHPGDEVQYEGRAKTQVGSGSSISAGALTWTVSTVAQENTFIHKEEGVASGTWTVPQQQEALREYWVKLWAEDDSRQRNVVQQVKVVSVLSSVSEPSTERILTTRDGNWKHAEPNTNEESKDRVLVKYVFSHNNSRVGYWDFTCGSEKAASAVLSLYCAGEMSGQGEFRLKWKDGHISEHGTITYNGRPDDGLFSQVGDFTIESHGIFDHEERFTGWYNFDITDTYNENLGNNITLRLEMLNDMGIGPEFSSLESGWIPGGASKAAGCILVTEEVDQTVRNNSPVSLRRYENHGVCAQAHGRIMVLRMNSDVRGKVVVADISGRTLASFSLSGKDTYTIDFSAYPRSGMYLVRVRTSGSTAAFPYYLAR